MTLTDVLAFALLLVPVVYVISRAVEWVERRSEPTETTDSVSKTQQESGVNALPISLT